MKFGPVSPREAEGATAVHTIRQGALVLKKGTLVGPAEVKALEAAGIKEIVVARLAPGDVSEDKAAADIARIHAPIGLEIGAISPSEIALAIMAEITAQLRLPKASAA
jgi:molybdenum cofactor cytidylyltransferase